jgi:hypothetical protein
MRLLSRLRLVRPRVAKRASGQEPAIALLMEESAACRTRGTFGHALMNWVRVWLWLAVWGFVGLGLSTYFSAGYKAGGQAAIVVGVTAAALILGLITAFPLVWVSILKIQRDEARDAYAAAAEREAELRQAFERQREREKIKSELAQRLIDGNHLLIRADWADKVPADKYFEVKRDSVGEWLRSTFAYLESELGPDYSAFFHSAEAAKGQARFHHNEPQTWDELEGMVTAHCMQLTEIIRELRLGE